MKKQNKYLSFKIILLIVNLIILTIPISSIFLFKIYENELIRQTEAELISQAAIIAAIYKENILKLGGASYGFKIATFKPVEINGFRYIPTSLDLSKESILSERMTLKSSYYDPEPLAIIATEQMSNILKEAEKTTLSSANILDFHGLIVANWKQYGQGLSLADNFEVSEALKGRFQSTLRERSVGIKTTASSAMRPTKFRVSIAFPVFNEDRLIGVVLLSRTPRGVMNALYQERHNLILAGSLVFFLMVFTSLIASLLIILPIRKLAGEAIKVADGTETTINSKNSVISVKEIANLRTSVSEMANKLNRRSEYLKAFASGVSHEFKTPLTSIKGAIELIREDGIEMDINTRKKFEENIFYDINRLERLVNKLLNLARAQAKNPAKEETTDIINNIKEFIKNYSSEKFSIILNTDLEKLNLNISSEVFETIIKNIIENSKEIGANEARIGVYNKSDFTYIRLKDNGPGIPEDLINDIFTPFVSTHKSKGGTGLGLSLTQTLLTQYRGQIRTVENKTGAIFEIKLPIS